jgi:hypothetical protein
MQYAGYVHSLTVHEVSAPNLLLALRNRTLSPHFERLQLVYDGPYTEDVQHLASFIASSLTELNIRVITYSRRGTTNTAIFRSLLGVFDAVQTIHPSLMKFRFVL